MDARARSRGTRTAARAVVLAVLLAALVALTQSAPVALQPGVHLPMYGALVLTFLASYGLPRPVRDR